MNESGCPCETLPKTIADALRKLEKKREFIFDHIQAVGDAEEVLEQFKDDPKLKGDYSYERSGLQLGFEAGSLKGALIMLYARDLRDVIPILRELRKRGYKIKKHDDYPELHARTYYLGKIIVRVFLAGPEANATCKFVQTGTKEVPVYEIKCGDKVPKIEEEVEA